MRGVLGRICAVFAVCVAPWLTGAAAAETALRISNGDRVLASLDEPGELDVYRISVPRGVDVRVRVRARRVRHALDVSVSDADARIRPGGRRGRATRIKLRDAAEGSYLVGVRSADGVATGDYRVDVSWGARRRLTVLAPVVGASDSWGDPIPGDGYSAAFTGVRGEFARITVAPAPGPVVLPLLARLEPGPSPIGVATAVDLADGTEAEVRLTAALAHYRVLVRNRSVFDGEAIVRVTLLRTPRRLDLRGLTTPPGTRVLVAEPVTPEGGGQLLGDAVDSESALPGEEPLPATLDALRSAVVRFDGADVALAGTWCLASAPEIDPGLPGLLTAGPALYAGPVGPSPEEGVDSTIELPCAVSAPRVFVRGVDGVVSEIPKADLEVAGGLHPVVRFRARVPATFQAFEQRISSAGVSVAASDERLVIGVPSELVDGVWEAGAVHVYVRGSDGWVEEARIVAEEPADSGRFGRGVVLSGNTLITYGNGRSLVYVRDPQAGWAVEDELRHDDGTVFASSVVAIDGDTMAVQDDSEVNSVGVFVRAGDGWHLEQKVHAPNDANAYFFGNCLDLSGDTLIVGGIWFGQQSPSVFTRTDGVWEFQDRLVGTPDAIGVLTAITVDGDVAAVGSDYYDPAGSNTRPEVSVFRRIGGAWTAAGILAHPQGIGTQGERIAFGSELDLQGGRLLVGAHAIYSHDGRLGRAYVYDDGGSRFDLVATLSGTPETASRGLGAVLALSPGGSTAIVGYAAGSDAPDALLGCLVFDVDAAIDGQ